MTPAKARALTIILHRNQTDKAGVAYAEHAVRVGDTLAEAEYPNATIMAGYLHDALEDTSATPESLAREGIPTEVVTIVQTLTRRRGESYAAYLERVRDDPDARVVKLADLHDNLLPDRLALLDAETRERLEHKYTTARAALTR